MKKALPMHLLWDEKSECPYHKDKQNLGLIGSPKCICNDIYLIDPPPSIVSYQSSSDGRLVVLGSNGRLYWYHSVWSKDRKELHQEWCIYPELPIEAKVNPFKN